MTPPVASMPPSLTALLQGWVTDRLPLWAHGLTHRVSRGTVLTVVGLVVAVVLGGFVIVHHRAAAAPAYAGSSWPGSSAPGSAAGASSSGPAASAPGAGATSGAASDSIVVDVGGRVRRPGLVTLPPGSRVADAIAAAGGALRHRDIATTDLAAKVGDGQLLLIGTTGSAGAAGATGAAPAAGAADAPGSASGNAAPVSLSSADLTTLETLPGVGPVTAQKIVDWRTAHNGFTSIEQLQQVPGIGPAHYAEVESLVTP
jgi:competence protein ComEA